MGGKRIMMLGFLAAILPCQLFAASQDSYGSVPAHAETYRPRFRAYAEVVPVQVLTVEAGIDGMLHGLAVLPGQRLEAGQLIARIGGAEQTEAMKEAQAKLDAATQRLSTAKDLEQSTARSYPKFAKRAELDKAKADMAAAEEQFREANAELARLRSLSTITAPAAGTVISLQAADGGRVSPGSPILRLQPEHDLWLKAVFYDVPATVLVPGRPARFAPAAGDSLTVHLATVLPSLRSDGGQPVTFVAASASSGLRAGESGEVVLQGEPRQAVSIPTAALILDSGRWWVLEATPAGLEHRAVQPGPSTGDRTLILQGLRPGAAVVVRDAYLLFHRDFSQQYVPPD